ncbi:MAG: thiol oxidoreductase [Gammaproteobacteria bacterium]|nr:thiol oxidoreductase [Gammaproteobacteria bacterium]
MSAWVLASVAAEPAPTGLSDAASLRARPLTPALGGATSRELGGERAFKALAANAAPMRIAFFTFGETIFTTLWEPAPGQPGTDGLGPVFNREGCAECHQRNGRGRPPQDDEAPMMSMLVRLSLPGVGLHGGPLPVPGYGDQLQDRAVKGVAAEGQAVIRWREEPGRFADGTPFSLRRPGIEFRKLAFGELPDGVLTSARVANPMIGLGLLEAVPETLLRQLADPDDRDGDGISGRVNEVWDAPKQAAAIGRFGWKASVASLLHQNAGAALGDMGITTPVFGEDLCESVQVACRREALAVRDSPELLPEFFQHLATYTRLLAVPRQRNPEAPAVTRGEALFRASGCAGCHLPTLVTQEALVPELANQVFHPFTDLLLHDMGEGLADGRPDFLASGSEWRTAPLWGIGHTEEVSGFSLYLHDGRARSLEEAILWHGGEAARARENFRTLSQDDRASLIAFLRSL